MDFFKTPGLIKGEIGVFFFLIFFFQRMPHKRGGLGKLNMDFQAKIKIPFIKVFKKKIKI